MKTSQTDIYVTSGTGNSLQVAQWFQEHLSGRVELRSMENSSPNDEIGTTADDNVVLVMPTHGFTAPWHVIKFALKLPSRKKVGAICIATRAGIRLGKLFLTGIAGSNFFLIALILMLKGYRIRSLGGIDMPSNWYSLHPIQGKTTQDLLLERARRKVEEISDCINNRKRYIFTINNGVEFLLGVALSIISLGYLCMGRFFFAKLFFANNKCDGCGICSRDCPVGAIKIYGKQKKPFWRYNCESCMKCAALCPKNAIEAGHSWAVVLYFLMTFPAAYYFFYMLGGYLPDYFQNNSTEKLINFLFGYPALFLSYYVFYFLGKLTPINWFFSKTTLTHYWGRYRVPGMSKKSLKPSKTGELILPKSVNKGCCRLTSEDDDGKKDQNKNKGNEPIGLVLKGKSP